LSDINEELINLYEIVKNNPNELIDLLEKQEISKEKFLEIRAWDREENWKEKYSKEQRAMRFMYLNRTCFN
jgi:DNA adenine methylase